MWEGHDEDYMGANTCSLPSYHLACGLLPPCSAWKLYALLSSSGGELCLLFSSGPFYKGPLARIRLSFCR